MIRINLSLHCQYMHTCGEEHCGQWGRQSIMIGVIIKILKWESCLNNFDRNRIQWLSSFSPFALQHWHRFYPKISNCTIHLLLHTEMTQWGIKKGQGPPVRRLLSCWNKLMGDKRWSLSIGSGLANLLVENSEPESCYFYIHWINSGKRPDSFLGENERQPFTLTQRLP